MVFNGTTVQLQVCVSESSSHKYIDENTLHTELLYYSVGFSLAQNVFLSVLFVYRFGVVE